MELTDTYRTLFGELEICLTHVPAQLGLNILLDLSAAVATPPVFVFVAGQLLPYAEYKHTVPTAFIANDKAREVNEVIVRVLGLDVISTGRHQSLHLVAEEERRAPDEYDDVAENCGDDIVPVLVAALLLWVEHDPQPDDVLVPLEQGPEYSDNESLRELFPHEVDRVFQVDVEEGDGGHVDHVAEDLAVWKAIIVAPALHLFAASLGCGLNLRRWLFGSYILSRNICLFD